MQQERAREKRPHRPEKVERERQVDEHRRHETRSVPTEHDGRGGDVASPGGTRAPRAVDGRGPRRPGDSAAHPACLEHVVLIPVGAVGLGGADPEAEVVFVDGRVLVDEKGDVRAVG